eukprot:scaffold3227_cov89-Skeletonema_dohrnii-CCMP3373.AAC.1
MRCGGPIAWKSVRQDRCSRSSCEAEIRATDEGIKEVLSLRARCADMSLTDANRPTPVYNDNQGCVDWSKTTSTKGLRHLNIRDCAVRDSIQAEEVSIHHIQGVINPDDIFTKEMKDGLHFRTLRDSFMMSHEAFRAFVLEGHACTERKHVHFLAAFSGKSTPKMSALKSSSKELHSSFMIYYCLHSLGARTTLPMDAIRLGSTGQTRVEGIKSSPVCAADVCFGATTPLRMLLDMKANNFLGEV